MSAEGGSREEAVRSLMEAAKRGDARGIREALGRGADPMGADEGGRSALHNAAASGSGEAARALLEAGCPADAWDRWKETPLSHALARAPGGGAEAARVLLEFGADPNGAGGFPKASPLALAAGRFEEEAARVLLEFGAEAFGAGRALETLREAGNEAAARFLEAQAQRDRMIREAGEASGPRRGKGL